MAFSKHILFTLTILFAVMARAKEGSYYLSHFQIPQDLGSAQNNTIVQDATNRLIIANREKIIIFDGENWSTIDTPSTPVSLHFDSNDSIVYIGCLHHFGYLETGENNVSKFTSISKEIKGFDPIVQIESTDKEVVFMSDHQLFIYDKNEKIDTLTLEDDNSFTQLIQNQNQIILSTSNGALSLLKEKKIKRVGFFPNRLSVVSHFSDSKYLIIVNKAGELYYFNGARYVKIRLRKPYLKNHEIIGILRLKNNRILIATEDEGAIVINRNTGRIESNINYANGLPDDRLHFMYHDRKGNAWFGHEYGLTKLDINIPFEDFSHFEGLKGHIQDVTYFKNKLYVATSVGLYYLSETEDYALVEKSSVLNKKETKKKSSRRRRKTTKKVTPQKVVLSIKKVFEKDFKIQSGCIDLQIINDKLIAVTEKGVFNIDRKKTAKIFEEEVSLVSYDLTRANKKIILLNKNNAFITLSLSPRNKWSFTKHEGGTLPFDATNLFHFKGNEYWVANNKKAARFTLEQDTVYDYQDYVIENPYSEPLWMQRYDKKLILFTNTKAFAFDHQKNSFFLEDSITKDMRASERILHSQAGITWLKHDNRWKNLSFVETKSKKFRFVSIVNDIKEIYLDQSQPNYWIVDKHDHLLYFSALKRLRMDSEFGIHLASIEDKTGEKIEMEELDLDHENTSLKLTYYTPFYLPSYQVLYRFKVEGQEDQWSEWSENNVLYLNGLQPNDYTVFAQAKTLFNDSIESVPLEIVIDPPYWDTAWFYTLEMLFFLGLIYMSFKINKTKSTQKRVIIFRKAMIFMTFIIFVEYFETIGQSIFDSGDSPVVSFFTQVLLAMAIFPLERFLSAKMKLSD